MSFLRDKKILFIAPVFHNLQNKIYEEMVSLGAKVDYYDERPKNNFITKVLIRLKLKKIISKQIKNYYQNILNLTKNETYDYIFIINLEAMPFSILKEFCIRQDKAKILLYMWDSLELKSISAEILKIVDRAYTFDPRDAKNHNMILLDLFYSKEYEELVKVDKVYDMCFIGTIHGDRYKLLKEIELQANGMNLNVYYYFFMPSKIMFWVRKLFDKNFHHAKFSEVEFKTLDAKHVSEYMNKSRAIIDLSYKNQRGLSMRTFETLGSKKKLITTNEEVKKYDFYNPENITIINKENIEIDKLFFTKKYQNIDEDIYKKYSLSTWLKVIFDEQDMA